jgi:GTP cyclohydrolase II
MPDLLRLTRQTSARLPTEFGEFQLHLYHNNHDAKEHLALAMGNLAGQTDLLTRIHSECFTGDVLGSRRCDCGPQLLRAMQLVAEADRGLIVYLRQEGRGIGLLDKLRAYNLQDEGHDTVEANLLLGHQADERDYTAAALILSDLGIASVQLLTNNPHKIEHLRALGVTVTARVPLQIPAHADNAEYLRTKAERLRHLL